MLLKFKKQFCQSQQKFSTLANPRSSYSYCFLKLLGILVFFMALKVQISMHAFEGESKTNANPTPGLAASESAAHSPYTRYPLLSTRSYFFKKQGYGDIW